MKYGGCGVDGTGICSGAASFVSVIADSGKTFLEGNSFVSTTIVSGVGGTGVEETFDFETAFLRLKTWIFSLTL